jgi:hypothetical protein
MTRKGLTGGPGLDEWIRDLVDSGIGIDLRPGPAGSLDITPAPLPRLPRAIAAAVASSTLRERTARRIARTVDLTAEGRTAREIGVLIASEEGEAGPFSPKTVKDWRARARGLKPSG